MEHLKTPIVVVNFKAYSEATGTRAVNLAKDIEKAGIDRGLNVAIAVQAVDIRSVASSVSIPVLAEHADSNEPGSSTGKQVIESLKDAGAMGTLINHSEFKLEAGYVGEVVARCREEGFFSLVCAENSDKAAKLAVYKPDMIAVEPSDLIGSGISVSEAHPEVITDTVEKVYRVRRLPVLCGAGIHEKKDVSKSLELGAKGVLVASGVVKDNDPYKETKDLLDGLKD